MDTDGPKPPQGSRDLGPTLHGVDFVLIKPDFRIKSPWRTFLVSKHYVVGAKVSTKSWHLGASFGIAMARAVEVNMGICAACAPMMKPFTRFIRAKLFNGDTRILHSNHHSNLSFWHGSWWRTNSKDDTPQGQIVLNRNIQSVSEEKARIAGRNNIAQKDFRIPSMSLGTDFQDRVGASSRLDYDTVEELKAEWPLKDRPESDLNEKSWFRNDEESR
ncbi:uncharacterized protein KY384_002461 [Bacidia gigantensis]|uniref:uncharacterized protein n=1 Tax=Bacidia gigantensis TaxID=2732470 RepID=UPI001D0494D9|nr:uncharacterized protein KY384_002461 [Bacidia gigantensis]KAG8532584.1 hypothetical protein KY384_002461 [Bacidia gigantensis]